LRTWFPAVASSCLLAARNADDPALVVLPALVWPARVEVDVIARPSCVLGKPSVRLPLGFVRRRTSEFCSLCSSWGSSGTCRTLTTWAVVFGL
jgi:hypothetical protein